MQRSYKLLSALLALLMLLSLASCVKQGQGDITTEAPSAVTEAEKLSIPIENIKIVRPIRSSRYELEASSMIVEEIFGKYKVIPKLVADTDYLSGGTAPDEVAIYVGRTELPESIAAVEALGEKEYSVSVIGKKIVIVCDSADENIIKTAVNAYIATLDSSVVNGTYTLDPSLVIKNKVTEVLGKDRLAYERAVGGGATTVNTQSVQRVYNDCTAELFSAYLQDRASGGMRIVAENKIGEIPFATLEDQNKKQLETVYYLSFQKQIRVITEPWHELVTELPSPQNAPSCRSTLFQLESQPSEMQSHIIRLSDGRYVIYDTGIEDAADKIMTYLRNDNKYTDGKIHIAAIYISHPHTDHMDGLKGLASKYSSELIVETVWANIIAASAQKVYTQSTIESRLKEIVNAAKKLGARFCFARSGQKLVAADGVFEVLFTVDDLGDYFLDGSDTKHDMNNACLIMRASIAGQKIIFTGDARGEQAPRIAAMYKTGLKCDIATVTHHGYNTVEALELYKAMLPRVLLWTNNHYETDRSFVRQLQSAAYVKKHILADKNTVIELPYNP